MLILSVFAPILLGLAILIRCLINKGNIYEWLLVFALLPGTGIAITSVLYFLYFRYFRPQVLLSTYAVFEIVTGLILLAGTLLWNHRQGKLILRLKSEQKIDLSNRKYVFLSLIVFSTFFIFFVNFLNSWYSQTLNNPHGNWDAWAIWNLRAKFIYSTEYWKNGFSSLISWSHPDYPLLIPSFIAREWSFLSQLSPAIPAIVGLFFLCSVVFVFVTGVGMIHGLSLGLFSGLFSLGIVTYSLKYLQYADLPLAFFFLATNLTFFLSETNKINKHCGFLLAGFFTGAALWTKNEGLAFLMAIIVGEIIWVLLARINPSTQKDRWLSMTIGSLPFLGAFILFQSTLAPTNDLVAGSTIIDSINKILDINRITVILDYFAKQIFAPWTLRVPMVLLVVFYLLIVGKDHNKTIQQAIFGVGLRLGLTLIFYFGIYLITPRPLEWHLNSSADRLFMQLLPNFILLVFLAARNPFLYNTNAET